jgi:tight adherence protein B
MQTLPMIMIGCSTLLTLILFGWAFSGPSMGKAQVRRMGSIRERHGASANVLETQMRRIAAARPVVAATGTQRLIPTKAALALRLKMTGKSWTVKQYLLASLGLATVVALGILMKGAPWYLAALVGLALGLMIPHMVISFLIKKRVADFTTRFPDAIELMVRGLRSGLPISETLSVVGSELPGAIGVEFQAIVDKVKIGRTMDEALLETAERLNTPEFSFFCITLAIQRETGGNLAETLSNLAEVLRKRAQMKLKIRAMSSESKASAYIVGSLPFIVFTLVWMMNPKYLGGFFYEPRLMIAGAGGLIWMSTGAFIMAKMVSFEI